MSTRTPTRPEPVRLARAESEKVAQSSAFEWLARAGFVARGLIYGIVEGGRSAWAAGPRISRGR